MAHDQGLIQSLIDEPSSITEILSGTTLLPDEPLVQQIYRILWDAIVTLKILPGQLVSEKEIAAVLNASKTPVREALIRIEDAGLVAVVPKSGTYVTPVRIEAYIEGCFLRLQLESGAARRAAERTGLAGQDRYISGFEDQLEAQSIAWNEENYVEFAALDELFHKSLFATAGLPGAWAFLQKTQADVNRVRQLKRIYGIRRGTQVVEQHIAIVDAIRDGDGDSASSALVAHLGSLESELEKLADYPELLSFIENQDTNLKRKHPGKRSATPDRFTYSR